MGSLYIERLKEMYRHCATFGELPQIVPYALKSCSVCSAMPCRCFVVTAVLAVREAC